MLNEALVNIESDGRVTTRKASPKDIRKGGRRMQLVAFDDEREDDNAPFSPDKPVGKVFDYLFANNVLREDKVLEEGKAQEWSLGHDSVGLTLNRWSQVYGYQFEQMSRMDMMATSSPDSYRMNGDNSLFGDEKVRTYHLQTITDSVWDHQILHYAIHKKFASRLGLMIDGSAFDTVGKKGHRPRKALDAALKEMNRVEPDEDKATFVIAWPRSEFPKKVERQKDWTDIVITNAYQGYGLLCPPVACTSAAFRPFEDLRRQLGKTTTEGARETYSNTLTDFCNSMASVADFIIEQNQHQPKHQPKCKVWLFDKSAEIFLDLVLELSQLTPERHDAIKSCAKPVEGDEIDARARDPIFAKILAGRERVDFMVGTAFGRALAMRTGYKSQIDVQDVHTLIDWVIGPDRRLRDNDPKAQRRRELTKKFQQTQTHTTWQLSLPHSEIDDQRTKELLYRMASLGFYTAEHIRTNMDDFVRYIDEHLQDTAPRGTFKLDRDFIRRSIRS
ncbi:MAG TPA: hypothetical protein VG897_05520, partial [Terriglobales bacterium]|nr:hypothetical protein [Terriglobales bacterium]